MSFLGLSAFAGEPPVKALYLDQKAQAPLLSAYNNGGIDVPSSLRNYYNLSDSGQFKWIESNGKRKNIEDLYAVEYTSPEKTKVARAVRWDRKYGNGEVAVWDSAGKLQSHME